MFYNTTKCIMEEGVKIKRICNGKAMADYFLLAFFTSFFYFLLFQENSKGRPVGSKWCLKLYSIKFQFKTLSYP